MVLCRYKKVGMKRAKKKKVAPVEVAPIALSSPAAAGENSPSSPMPQDVSNRFHIKRATWDNFFM